MPAFAHLLIQAFGLLLLLSLFLLLLGCTPSLVATPTGSTRLYPPVTLTVVNMQTLIAATPHASSLAADTARLGLSLSAHPPSPSPQAHPELHIQAPTCYPQGSMGWACLGQVSSSAPYALRDVVLLAEYPAPGGAWVAAQRVALEQERIPGGGFAPYRVHWTGQESSISPAPSSLLPPVFRLSIASATRDERPSSPLAVVKESATWRADGRYHLVAQVRNDGLIPFQQISASATLFNGRHEVVGFRLKEASQPLVVGGTWKLELDIIPQVEQKGELYHILQVQGR